MFAVHVHAAPYDMVFRYHIRRYNLPFFNIFFSFFQLIPYILISADWAFNKPFVKIKKTVEEMVRRYKIKTNHFKSVNV